MKVRTGTKVVKRKLALMVSKVLEQIGPTVTYIKMRGTKSDDATMVTYIKMKGTKRDDAIMVIYIQLKKGTKSDEATMVTYIKMKGGG